jgi:hypothetical protein
MKKTMKLLAGFLLAAGLTMSATAQRANGVTFKKPLKAATSQEEIQNFKKGQK